ncbi:MAG: porin family protein [Gammaproteobacteria bacterium]|nr:porin family protein [Gammaproteobacteria bacterium]
MSCDTGYCINFNGQSNTPAAKSTPGAALHFGYIFSNMPLQFELSYQYLYRLSYNNDSMLVDNISHNDSLSSDVHNHALFANVIVPLRNNSPFMPFVLAGLGINRSSVESKYTYQNQLTKGYTTVSTNYDQVEGAWQVGAGFYVNLTKQLLLNVSYKYQDLGPVTWRVNYNGVNDFSSKALTDNQGEIGLTYLIGANSHY